MEKARCNTELYSNLRTPRNNVKPSNFWGSHQQDYLLIIYTKTTPTIPNGTNPDKDALVHPANTS